MGLSALFPSSSRFNYYSLGHLNNQENHEVDVLAGAFMMVPKRVLDLTGGFDERFFMYGEDIDLSYRIQKAGFHNFYFAGSTILHFKGESTRKGSLNYVLLFYKAMLLFVQKNYRGSKAGFFRFFIQLAIILRGLLSVLYKIFVFPLKNAKKGVKINKNGPESMILVQNADFLKTFPIHKNNVILFSESDQFSWKQILKQLEQYRFTRAQFRFQAAKSKYIIGSDSKETEGEAQATHINS